MALSGVSTDMSDEHLQRRRHISAIDAAKLADVSHQHANQIFDKIKKQTSTQEPSPVPKLKKQASGSPSEEEEEGLEDYYDQVPQEEEIQRFQKSSPEKLELRKRINSFSAQIIKEEDSETEEEQE